ncbi:hypothetical protein OSTOST_01209 [Ostertagia ostertagi]
MVPYIIPCDIISPRVAVLKVKLQKLGNRTLKMVRCGSKNDRGNRLIEFAEQHQFSITNIFFEKKAKRLWTWRSSDARALRQIDYVLTDTPRFFADVSVIGENVIDCLRSSAFAFGDPLRCQERTSSSAFAKNTHMNTGSNIDADYEDLVGKITEAVKASSIAIEPTRRRRISTENCR